MLWAVCSMVLPSLARKKKTDAKQHSSVASVEQRDTLTRNDKKRYDYFFLEAARQQSAGHYSEAFNLLEHCRKINPNAPEVYYYESMYYSQMKQDSVALACMKKAVSLNPDNQHYAERLAQYYIGTQEYDKAIDAYEQLYAHNHDNTDALQILLQLYQQQKNYDMMLHTIDRMEIAEGESEQLTLNRMRIYEMKGDKKAAYNVLKTLTVKHPLDMVYKTMLGNWLVQNKQEKEAYKLFSEVEKEEPGNAYNQSSLYDYYNATGQTELANEILDKILLGKNTDVATKAVMIRQFIQRNESNGGDSTQVINLFDRILAQPNPSADIAELRAAYIQLKKMPQDSVNAAYEKVLAIAPDRASARIQVIENLWDVKDYDKVIAMSKEAHEYNPEDMIFYYFSGLAHYMKQEEDETLAEFHRGIAQINESSTPELVSELYAVMGEIYAKRDLNAEAFAAYDSCLQWKSDNYMSLNNYAYYLSVRGGDLQKAELMSYKTIKAEPTNSTYLDTYAWILFMEERYAEAKTYIDQMLMHADTTEVNATLYGHAGDIYAMNGLTEQALAYWQQAYDAGDKSDIMEWKINNKQYITEETYRKQMEKKQNAVTKRPRKSTPKTSRKK